MRLKPRKRTPKNANPPVGFYYSILGDKIFLLRDQEGPYPLMNASGTGVTRERASLYTFEDSTGSYRDTLIEEPFDSNNIFLEGSWSSDSEFQDWGSDAS